MLLSEYKTKRAELLNKADQLIKDGKLDEANTIMADIEKLDNDFEEKAKQQANRNALENKTRIIDICSRGVNVQGKVIDSISFGGGNMRANMRATEEYKQAFIMTLQGTATPDMKDMVTTSTGAAVIPETTFDEIIENVQKRQGILSRVRVLQIPGNCSIPTSDINTPAAWHEQGTEIEDSSKEPSSIKLKGYELAKLFSMSAATRSMSIPTFERYLVSELSRCTADALNEAIFSGSGVGQPSGLNTLTFDVTNLVTTGVKTVEYDDLVKALGLLASNFSQNAAWVMSSKTFYTYIATIQDQQDRPLFITDATQAAPMKILGKEVILDDFTPDNTIFLGDPKFYFFNFSQPMTVEISTEAGFTKGTIMYRSMAVVDGKPLPSGAFVKVAIPQA